ncbi:MAG: hypothetical protein JWN46_1868 [Acidimicrobiales bacterium]|nr:hypothetical protein [Acidimicrobiales bacterium]
MTIHHVTIWVPDLSRASDSWGWLLERIGFASAGGWETGRMWQHGTFRLVLEQSPDMVPGMLHSRLRPGMNHLAFSVASPGEAESIAAEAHDKGWSQIGADAQLHAPAPGSFAVYLEDADRFEVELVAPTEL